MEYFVHQRFVLFHSFYDAESERAVFQNLALADDLDVPSNLFLGREKVLFNLGPFSILDRKAMRDVTKAALQRTAVKIPNLSNTIRNM